LQALSSEQDCSVVRAIAFEIAIMNRSGFGRARLFSRAARIRKIDGALAPGAGMLLHFEILPEGLKP